MTVKSYELQPTSENILLTLEDDLIDRNEVSFRFLELLDSLEGSHTIAIDGKWGSGKTFFVKQLKMILDAYNPNGKEGDSEGHTRIKNSMEKHNVNGKLNSNLWKSTCRLHRFNYGL